MKTDERVLAELAAAAAGLWLMSESDYPLEPLRFEGDDFNELRRLAAAGEDAPVETRDFEDFFDAATLVTLKQAGGAERAGRDRIEKLKRVLSDNLRDLRVYRVGSVNIAVYILGRSAAGNFLGLSTRVVET